MPQIRVLLIDDSPLFVAAMKVAISKDPGMAVVATASNGLDGLALVPKIKPDVILCDVQMPKMDGIEFLQALLQKQKIPVVVISSTPGITLTALANGAVDFISKPAEGESRDLFFSRVVNTIQVAAAANMGAKMAVNEPAAQRSAPGMLKCAHSDIVVAIGASTGGTDATLDVIRNLPQGFPGIVITQHMPAGFTSMYAQRLDRECKMRVREAQDGMRVENGLIILAAGGYHMSLLKDAQGYYVRSREGAKVNGHVPSVDVLFNSVADVAGAKSVGIILTGMGADGADGLLKMRKAGAYTIGQNKESSIVYGMPMVAHQKGAVMKQLPLNDIAACLVAQLNRM